MNSLGHDQESFHDSHERLAEEVYKNPGMLPDRYVFILTNRCNLRCPFCFLRKDGNNLLTPQRWMDFAKQLPDYARVTLTGGEPLLYEGFKEVFSFVAERFECNIITNGTLLTENYIDLFLSFSKFRVLSISIDSVDNTTRKINKNLWDHTKEMIRYFLKQRDRFGHRAVLDVKTLILNENSADLFDIHQYCIEEIGCDSHAFQFLKGSPIQHADRMFDFDDIEQKARPQVYMYFPAIVKELEKIRRGFPHFAEKTFLHPKIASFSSVSPISDIEFINSPGFLPASFRPCKFPWSSVHINADGNLYPCLAVSMGNILDSKLTDIVNGERFVRFRSLIDSKGHVEACVRCGWLRPLHMQGSV